MKLKLGLYIYILFFGISYAQVGINTENPKSTLHLAASSNSHPTGEDGIIIPRVNEFPIGQEKGHLFFLKGNSSHQTGFYYYDGKDWESFLVDGLDRTVDESIYVFMGTGFINETPGLTKTVILNQYAIPINSDDWSLANNQIKVGKSGKYLMMFNSSLKRPIPTSGVQGRSTFVFEVVKNGQSTVLSGATSTANEESTAIGISMSNLVEWRKLGSFFSMNKLTEDKTITYVSSEDLFSDGSLMTGTALSTKYIKFDQNSLLANDIENFEVNNNGELIVRKKGTYHINAVISLHYDVANGARRDAFEGEIQLNGNSLPFPLKAHYGFPNAGTDFVFDNSFAITGFVELNENDRLRLKLYRYYADSPGSAVISPNGQQTNLTLRYMGEL